LDFPLKQTIGQALTAFDQNCVFRSCSAVRQSAASKPKPLKRSRFRPNTP